MFTMKRGHTIVELMLSVLIVSMLFSGILTVMAISNRSWHLGQDKMTEQQQARKAMSYMTSLLRETNAEWIIGGSTYRVTISENNTRIDFYNPVFDSAGGITGVKKITFKLNPSDPSELLKKEGTLDSVVIGTNLSALSFSGGCAGCVTFNCSTVATDCPVVKIQLTTRKQADFVLNSQVTLRNRNAALSSDSEVEEPPQGEF